MKIKRNLSGIYIRTKNEETGKFENVCFEDLECSFQKDFLKTKDFEWISSLCIALAETINDIGNEFDLIKQ